MSEDVDAMKDLLLWARSQKLDISQATVGGVTIILHDPMLATMLPKRKAAAVEMPQDPYQRWGGEALRAMADDGALNTTYEDDD